MLHLYLEDILQWIEIKDGIEQRNYRTIVYREGENDDPETFIKKQYSKEINDEFVKPSVSINYSGIDYKRDGVIFMNLPDRMRQITHALCDENFKNFLTDRKPFLFQQ